MPNIADPSCIDHDAKLKHKQVCDYVLMCNLSRTSKYKKNNFRGLIQKKQSVRVKNQIQKKKKTSGNGSAIQL